MALQRAELRLVHDVCAPRRRKSRQGRAPGAVWRIHRLVPGFVPGIPHRPVQRSAFYLAGNSGDCQPVGADHLWAWHSSRFRFSGFRGWPRTRDGGSCIPSLTLFSSQFLWFLLPAAISLLQDLDIPQNRYSTGVLAVMHSAQYLWITSYYARREASGEPRDEERSQWRPFAYFGVLIVGGIALFVPGPWLASRALHHDFTASFLIFTALVNIHHFILDGAIWKLRDGRIAVAVAEFAGTHRRRRMPSQSDHFAARMAWTREAQAARGWLQSECRARYYWFGERSTRPGYYLALRSDD